MNKQVQENMLSVIKKFLTNAPPGCDVEVTVKYNLAKEKSQQVQSFTTKLDAAESVPSSNPDRSRKTDRPRCSTPLLARKLRSEERVALKDAVPILSPVKKTTEDSTRYEIVENRKTRDAEEVNVSAESFRKPTSEKETKTKSSQQSDLETDDLATSELFPLKKALRYNKSSGKYDDISY